MEFLTFDEVVSLHGTALKNYGGEPGIRDEGLIHSAVNQPLMTFGGFDLYPTVLDKATALGFSLAKNHAFVDGNKRVALYAINVFLFKNGFRLNAGNRDAEDTVRGIADGSVSRGELLQWIRLNTVINL